MSTSESAFLRGPPAARCSPRTLATSVKPIWVRNWASREAIESHPGRSRIMVGSRGTSLNRVSARSAWRQITGPGQRDRSQIKLVWLSHVEQHDFRRSQFQTPVWSTSRIGREGREHCPAHIGMAAVGCLNGCHIKRPWRKALSESGYELPTFEPGPAD